MWNFPTLEPLVMSNGSFAIERVLPQAGEILVGVGDRVAQCDVIAHSIEMEQTLTLYVASELGVQNSELSKYVAKTIGVTVKKGDVVARVRRGLRTANVKSPVDGTLVSVDDSNGTIIVNSSLGKRDLLSLVDGEVEQIVPDRGAIIRTSGARVYGIAGFGTEAIGRLEAGADRPDRELTADNVSNDWKGSIVLAGMTAGVPALTKLREVGVAGVIMGSIPEGDVRRFLTGGQTSQEGFWSQSTAVQDDLTHPSIDAPFVIVVTEGFGRRPMTEQIFDILTEHRDSMVSVSARTSMVARLARPEIYLGSEEGSDLGIDNRLVEGRIVRTVDSGAVSVAGTVASEPYARFNRFGVRSMVADVSSTSGDIRRVPVSNIEVVE